MNTKVSGILVSLCAAIFFSGNATAEIVKGRVRAVAGEAEVFTLKTEAGMPLFLQWNSKTAWKNFDHKGAIRVNEPLIVDLGSKPENHLAVTVERIKAVIPEGIGSLTSAGLALLLEATAERRPIIADARPTEYFDAGHINGAISVPLGRLEKRVFAILPQDKMQEIIFYDDGTGWGEAPKAATIARKAGHKNIRILAGGLTAWIESGRFPAASSGFIRKAKPAVIDLSSFYTATKGHIEGAANIPLAQLQEKKEQFPLEKHQPFVLYGENDNDALQGGAIIRKWGYSNIAILYGGTREWLANAEVLESGPPSEVIPTASASHGGALLANDFEQALHSPIMVEIVDVRSAAEQKNSGFPNSRKIPLATLAKRIKELDREKIQVIFAADAERAEMAYNLLKAKKFKGNYFAGSVEFEKDGKYKLR
jgi:rhodanese-related sulfurtransferase